MEEELRKCKDDLAKANSEFDDLLASSKEIEDEQALQIKELEEQLKEAETELNNTSSMKKETLLLRDKVDDMTKKLAETVGLLEKTRQELREVREMTGDEIKQQKDKVVSLESEITSLQEGLRVAEASGERYKQRYETLLETSALANCELEELRLKIKETEQRKKVEVQESSNNNNNDNNDNNEKNVKDSEEIEKLKKELERVNRESNFIQQLLKEVLTALSKGSVTIPSAEQILKQTENK